MPLARKLTHRLLHTHTHAHTHTCTLARTLARTASPFPAHLEPPGRRDWAKKVATSRRRSAGGRQCPASAGPQPREAWGPGYSLPGSSVLRLRPTRNARVGFPELPRDCRNEPRSPGTTGQGRRQEGQGAERPSQSLDLLPSRSHRRGHSWTPANVPGRGSGSEGPRSAHARRPGGCSSELQAKFSALPLGTGRGLGVVAVRPEQEPRPRRSGGQDGGLGSKVSVQAWSAPPARVLGARLPHRAVTQRRQTGRRSARPAAPPLQTGCPP